ncbi:hypothetical protein [uncultured Idiomarina sp.]|uniref:hypothetical protein n=1 Tax=uncultured Idiomarina sp. TaxID=352961 RepID=UPI0032B15BEA|tara:strand:+ start:1757 stop:2434 length:678 start_codon:yes stop_codon:yes gene_type:complete
MSHILDIDGQNPDRSGALARSISNLNDTSFNSLATNDVLAHDGSNWINSIAAENTVASVKGIDTATGYLSTPPYDPVYQAADGFYINFRWKFSSPLYLLTLESDTTYANHIVTVFTTTSQYWRGFQLEPGHRYQLTADVCLPSNSSVGAYVEVQWQTDASVALGPKGYIRQRADNMSRILGFIDLSSASGTTNVGLKNLSISGTVTWLQNGIDNKEIAITARIIE